MSTMRMGFAISGLSTSVSGMTSDLREFRRCRDRNSLPRAMSSCLTSETDGRRDGSWRSEQFDQLVKVCVIRRLLGDAGEISSEGNCASKHFVEHQSERIDVRVASHFLPTRPLFGRRVEKISQPVIVLCFDGVSNLLLLKVGDPKVCDNEFVCALGEEDVFGFKVSVPDTLQMRGLSAVQNLTKVDQNPFRRYVARHQFSERSRIQGHDIKRCAVCGDATGEYLDDVPMVGFCAKVDLVPNRFKRTELAFSGSRIFAA